MFGDPDHMGHRVGHRVRSLSAGRLRGMHARSAVFDLFGDYVVSRGGRAQISAMVRLLDAVGIASPAVRTAVSRMVAQGWLEPADVGGGRGYALTPQAHRRLSDAGARIYGRDRTWDGTWHLAVLDATPSGRSARSRLRADLEFLGYAQLAADTWVSPHPSRELEDVVRRAGARVTTGQWRDVSPAEAPLRAWDLSALAAAYDGWLAEFADLAETATESDETAFSVRFRLVHEWRKFLFLDPGLPTEVLPEDWPGRAAAAVFDRHADGLRPAADRFVAQCLGETAGGDWQTQPT